MQSNCCVVSKVDGNIFVKIFGRAVACICALLFLALATLLPVSGAHAQTITSFTPGSGPTTGGTTVVITGTGFTNVTSVDFQGFQATFTVDSPTQITATSPFYGGPGSAPIRVVTQSGSAVSATNFLYVQAPQVGFVSPFNGSTAGGTV